MICVAGGIVMLTVRVCAAAVEFNRTWCLDHWPDEMECEVVIESSVMPIANEAEPGHLAIRLKQVVKAPGTEAD